MKAPSAVRRLYQLFPKDLTLWYLDLMWSDPDEVETWAVSPRGAGWLFGGSITNEVREASVDAESSITNESALS
jgi:hypothetical protein